VLLHLHDVERLAEDERSRDPLTFTSRDNAAPELFNTFEQRLHLRLTYSFILLLLEGGGDKGIILSSSVALNNILKRTALIYDHALQLKYGRKPKR